MSFSSLEVGHGASPGAALYPLRTLARDLLERMVQTEVRLRLERAEDLSLERPDEDHLTDWLRSDDSPLLLHNVEEFILNPEAHLRAIAERLEGPGRAQHSPGEELTGVAAHARAEELRARLRTVAELDAERVLATPRRRGTPKGETRTHYVWLVSPDRDISNAEFKRLISEVTCRRWSGAVIVGYIHRDTDNTHLHLWMSAETLSEKKISVTRATPSGDRALDKYPDLDEEVARAVSRHFGDPSIYEDHIAKKLEFVHWRERFEEALRRGERPPVMPHRARHDYDWLGERRAVAGRERDESRPRCGATEKAGPVPRAKSLGGALELCGKVVHLRTRVGYRRALLATHDLWGDQIGHPVEGVREYLGGQLAQAEREHERHERAFEKTLENRARKGYPERKYPLYNSKQIAEMAEIARLTRDAELFRHIRSYTELDRPTGRESQVREVGERWRDQVEARLEVLELADVLVKVAGRPNASPARAPAGAEAGAPRPPFDRDREIVNGWLLGGWTLDQLRDSLPCFEAENLRRHAERYLKGREYFGATCEALAAASEGIARLAARPTLDDQHLARIDRLVGGESRVVDDRERTLLRDLAALSATEREAGPRETARLLGASLAEIAIRGGEDGRGRGARADREAPRPHDDEWAGRLARLLTLRETEALALAVSGAPRERFEAVREDIYAARSLMELTRAVRVASGMAVETPEVTIGAAEDRVLQRHRQAIEGGLRSRGEGWVDWQAAGVREFRNILPAREQSLAGRVIEEVEARLEVERREESLARLEPQLDSAAQFYLRAAYRDEGLDVMRSPRRRNDHVRGLADRLSEVARDAGHDPARLGLGRRELEARAGRALSDAVERYGREERDAYELGRLEARMILACAVRDEAAARAQRFTDHANFHDWHFQTLEGRGRTSICEIWLTYNEATDPAAVLVAQDAEQYIVRSIIVIQERLAAAETISAQAAEAARRAYEARTEELSRQGVTTGGPLFEPGELARLEEAAFITRDHELIGLVAKGEEQTYGPEYAAARAQGRELRAAALVHAEHGLPERHEHPVAARRLERLPEQVRESLSSLIDQHRAARESERAAALAFRGGLESQARERADEAPRAPRGAVRPLLTEVEAGEIYARMLTTGSHERRSWEQRTMYAEVIKGDGQREGRQPSLHEWARQNMAAFSRGGEYVRAVGDETVMSQSEAQAIIRQQERELGLNRPTPSRGR